LEGAEDVLVFVAGASLADVREAFARRPPVAVPWAPVAALWVLSPVPCALFAAPWVVPAASNAALDAPCMLPATPWV
jgi:hypothetical protein